MRFPSFLVCRYTPETPLLPSLLALLAPLPPGRGRVALALVEGGEARTYPEVAALLGLSPGSVHTHLRRLRQRHPDGYTALRAERARQLAARHRAAVLRDREHSRRWHRRQANRRYFYRFGCWPWERSGRR